ncbi:MAG: scpA [Burkholderiales bacterium]|jgi:segregation and condensation protein A|nr:scpA [Burkholderiales bacterium]
MIEQNFEIPKDLYIDPEALQVFLDMFEGPLDLLLYLIRRQNLDILTIPIAKIATQYISYINAMQTLNIDLAAEYLLMAAMLLEIKSRMLLPRPKHEDSENEEDPRNELIQKLIEYEKIKHVAQNLADMPQANRDYFWLDVSINDSETILPSVNIEDLQNAWHSVLLKSLANNKQHHIKRQELSVREHMSNIIRTLQNTENCAFFDLFDVRNGVSHVVVNFIAILELGKEGIITLFMQENEIFVSLRIANDTENFKQVEN